MIQLTNLPFARTKIPYGHRFVYHPVPCLWPWQAEEDGPTPWDPTPARGACKKLLAPGFRATHVQSLQPFGQGISRQKIFLCLSLCGSAFARKISSSFKKKSKTCVCMTEREKGKKAQHSINLSILPCFPYQHCIWQSFKFLLPFQI